MLNIEEMKHLLFYVDKLVIIWKFYQFFKLFGFLEIFKRIENSGKTTTRFWSIVQKVWVYNYQTGYTIVFGQYMNIGGFSTSQDNWWAEVLQPLFNLEMRHWACTHRDQTTSRDYMCYSIWKFDTGHVLTGTKPRHVTICTTRNPGYDIMSS